MELTINEAFNLIDRAKQYLERVWITAGKEYKFVTVGTIVLIVVKPNGDLKAKSDKYRINGTTLKANDHSVLPKMLEEIVRHFENKDAEKINKPKQDRTYYHI